MVFVPIDPISERVYVPTYEDAVQLLNQCYDNKEVDKKSISDLEKMIVYYNDHVALEKKEPKLVLASYNKPAPIASFLA